MVHRRCLYANNTNTPKEYCYWFVLNKPGIKYGLIIVCTIEDTKKLRKVSGIINSIKNYFDLFIKLIYCKLFANPFQISLKI